MTRYSTAFLDTIPASLRPNTLYVSMIFRTASHLCACGCGNEVVTPLAPDMWSLRFDGESVTLRPSVGSYSLPCRSHYLVTDSQIGWLPSTASPSGKEAVVEPRQRDPWRRFLTAVRRALPWSGRR